MGNSDDMVSNDTDSTMDLAPKKPKKNTRDPKCTRCQNHGMKVRVKYHKRECPNRFCLCDKCITTTKRQEIMRKQTAKRREREQEEMLREMRKNQLKLKGSETSSAPSINGSTDSNSCDLPNISNLSIISGGDSGIGSSLSSVKLPLSMNLLPQLSHTSSSNMSLYEPETHPNRVEDLLGYSAWLLQRLGYPFEALSLMYVILKDCKDIEIASRRINIAKKIWQPEVHRTMIFI